MILFIIYETVTQAMMRHPDIWTGRPEVSFQPVVLVCPQPSSIVIYVSLHDWDGGSLVAILARFRDVLLFRGRSFYHGKQKKNESI